MFKEKDKIQAEEGNFTFKQGLRYAELNSRYGVSIGALYSTKGIKKAAKSVDEALNDEQMKRLGDWLKVRLEAEELIVLQR